MGTQEKSNFEELNLGDITKDIENDVELIKDFGFAETNKIRKEKGLALYSEQEYNAEFFEMHQNAIKSTEESIERATDEIEKIKSQLAERQPKIDELKEMLSEAIKKDNTELISRTQHTLEAYEETFDEDKLLDKISSLKKDIENYNKEIESHRSVLAKLESPQEEKYLGKYEIDPEGFVYFGDIARGMLGMQCQYASRYLDGALPELGYPNLGESLRLKDVFHDGKATGNYHDYKIHKDDIDTFVQRVKEYMAKR